MGVVNRNGGLQPEHVESKREGRGEAYRESERERGVTGPGKPGNNTLNSHLCGSAVMFTDMRPNAYRLAARIRADREWEWSDAAPCPLELVNLLLSV